MSQSPPAASVEQPDRTASPSFAPSSPPPSATTPFQPFSPGASNPHEWAAAFGYPHYPWPHGAPDQQPPNPPHSQHLDHTRPYTFPTSWPDEPHQPSSFWNPSDPFAAWYAGCFPFPGFNTPFGGKSVSERVAPNRPHPYAKTPRFVPPPLPPPAVAIAHAIAAQANHSTPFRRPSFSSSAVAQLLNTSDDPSTESVKVSAPDGLSFNDQSLRNLGSDASTHLSPEFTSSATGPVPSTSAHDVLQTATAPGPPGNSIPPHPMYANPYSAMAYGGGYPGYGMPVFQGYFPMPPYAPGQMMDFAGFMAAAASAGGNPNLAQTQASKKQPKHPSKRVGRKMKTADVPVPPVASSTTTANDNQAEFEDDTGDVRHYVIFNRITYELMMRSLRADIGLPELIEGTEAHSYSRHIDLKNAHTTANVSRKKWVRLKGRMTYLHNDHRSRCITWKDCHLIIAPQEEWTSIVLEFHTAPNMDPSQSFDMNAHLAHNSLKQTYQSLKKVYQTRRSRCGIPYETIAAIMATCPDCQNMRFINSPARLRGTLPSNIIPQVPQNQPKSGVSAAATPNGTPPPMRLATGLGHPMMSIRNAPHSGSNTPHSAHYQADELLHAAAAAAIGLGLSAAQDAQYEEDLGMEDAGDVGTPSHGEQHNNHRDSNSNSRKQSGAMEGEDVVAAAVLSSMGSGTPTSHSNSDVGESPFAPGGVVFSGAVRSALQYPVDSGS